MAEARNPLAVVEEIASAQLFVGTSLHGRIISACYDVPRVSLNGEKLNEYAAQWDSEMPFGRELTQLGEAAAEARQARHSVEGTGARLATLALENARQLKTAVRASNLQNRVVRRVLSVEQLRRDTIAPSYVGHVNALRRHIENPRGIARRAKRGIVRRVQQNWR